MTDTRTRIEDEAIGWLIRQRDPLFDDWDGFTAWLETGPDRVAAYDRIALADADIDAVLSARETSEPRAANDDEPTRGTTRRRMLGWGIAASLLGMIGYSSLNTAPTTYVVATGAQGRETIKLADGSRIDLNASTRLILDRDNPRFARLDRGEALFTVVHDAENPFIVQTGGATLMDAGTAFNVIRDAGRTEVSVSEGLVIYNPDSDRVALAAGRMLRATGKGQIKIANLETRSVASWREGQLVYDNVPLSIVASDLSRNLGVEIGVGKVAGRQSFSGVVQLGGTLETVVERTASVTGVSALKNGKGWTLAAEGDAPR